MTLNAKDREAYRRVVAAFKKQKTGAAVADIVAGTALPLERVRELVPLAADEYGARLEVTESGEIRYSFPRGFTSKYRGLGPTLGRFFEKAAGGFKAAGVFLFKAWILVMLAGYFILFMLIALAALCLSMAAAFSNSKGNSRGNSSRGSGAGGLYFGIQIFNLIIRLWFYSELTRSLSGSYSRNRGPAKPKGLPLYKAVFSFVFGDGDPNRGWDETEKKALIAYIQSHRGVICLPEYMALTGKGPAEAEAALMAFCVEFKGSPEATGEGTIVYRFDELLLRSDTRDRSFDGASAPLKRLKIFSQNPGKTNTWFALINGVNLVFGAYFLVNALGTGIPQAAAAGTEQGVSLVYAVALSLFYAVTGGDPLPFVAIGLGLVPLIFSFLFWLIPAVRSFLIKEENEGLKLENFRKLGYGKIWSSPGELRPEDLGGLAVSAECKPQNPVAGADRVIKDLGTIAVPDITVDDKGMTSYSFTGLERERAALEKYRADTMPQASLGKVVFDSGA